MILRRTFLTAALLSGLALQGAAQSLPLSPAIGIHSTITAQIDAFRADDFPRAFSYASPTLRKVFRTPDNFRAMVQFGYPMVWKPADLRFLELREAGGLYWQRVMITDAAGDVYLLDYQMIRCAEGWRINAVQPLPILEPAV
ncbi:DUF4864 domain-containing protein [Chachezhania sediminis]|uniref:DUF4864 domain-containing protein n=1 Tax=Chachezhania sediminis TaxID=2599291 RepID=UPI001E621702|nr:DUF4864 domain-containing protein [Chachezhania sediminis]